MEMMAKLAAEGYERAMVTLAQWLLRDGVARTADGRHAALLLKVALVTVPSAAYHLALLHMGRQSPLRPLPPFPTQLHRALELLGGLVAADMDACKDIFVQIGELLLGPQGERDDVRSVNYMPLIPECIQAVGILAFSMDNGAYKAMGMIAAQLTASIDSQDAKQLAMLADVSEAMHGHPYVTTLHEYFNNTLSPKVRSEAKERAARGQGLAAWATFDAGARILVDVFARDEGFSSDEVEEGSLAYVPAPLVPLLRPIVVAVAARAGIPVSLERADRLAAEENGKFTAPCAACGYTRSSLRCAICKTRIYCGRACQKFDWKTHKGDHEA